MNTITIQVEDRNVMSGLIKVLKSNMMISLC